MDLELNWLNSSYSTTLVDDNLMQRKASHKGEVKAKDNITKFDDIKYHKPLQRERLKGNCYLLGLNNVSLILIVPNSSKTDIYCMRRQMWPVILIQTSH